MKFIFLFAAILLEVVGSSFLKASEGFSKLVPTLISLSSYALCFYLLSLALKYMPLGITYAIWCGLGIILTSIVSIVIFKEKIDFAAIVGIVLIISGVVVLNVFSKAGH